MLLTEVNQYFAFGLSGVTSWLRSICSSYKKQIYGFLSVDEACKALLHYWVDTRDSQE